MKSGTAAVLTVLLGCLAPPAEAQTSARIFVVMVDDLRFTPSETRNAEQLLALLRDEILTEADLVGIVSTGPLVSRRTYTLPPIPGGSTTRFEKLRPVVYCRCWNQPPEARLTVQIPAATPT
jgi:hypothetical protein